MELTNSPLQRGGSAVLASGYKNKTVNPKEADLEQFTCHLCGGKKCDSAFSAFDFDQAVEPFELLRCKQCNLTQTWPVPSPESLDGYYSRSYYGGGAKKFSGLIEQLTVLGNRLRAKKIHDVIGEVEVSDGPVKVLDIGCGRANLLKRLKALGCKCFGIEREEYTADEDASGIDIHRGTLEDKKFEDSYFDAVVIWHVLEHLPEPIATLDEVARITRKGGVAVIAVPNFSSWQSKWFKSNWFHLDLPRHLFHFGVENLSDALEKRGYVIHAVSTCSLEQNLFGFIQSLMNSFGFLGKPNSFYQLLKSHVGVRNTVKLAGWLIGAVLILPFALLELIASCVLKKGASVVIYARKT